ncbi:MAG: hypothetical protein COA47_14430 [Robiginitomaculum sp.]|nr:MAG: hypothetical protein COA47_14430 [Robiginitomaculum sp.]
MENIQQKILDLIEVEKKEQCVNATPTEIFEPVKALVGDKTFMKQADAKDVAYMVAISKISSFGLSPSEELSFSIFEFISMAE